LVDLCACQLTKIEGLMRLAFVEELSLEENRLTSLDGLENLKLLKKLEVGKNQIVSVCPARG
jgi:Leucine-rich repeat (LRR) protein